MKDFLSLVFAVFVGLIAGTLPGIREKFPWGRPTGPTEAELQRTAEAQLTATPPPAPGAWMHNTAPRTQLDKPAGIGGLGARH